MLCVELHLLLLLLSSISVLIIMLCLLHLLLLLLSSILIMVMLLCLISLAIAAAAVVHPHNDYVAVLNCTSHYCCCRASP
jgi:hypothetical protein